MPRGGKTASWPFYLGCPVWSCRQWTGEVYPRGCKKADWLHHYTRQFNTVEGNSTFYGLPSLDTARRWADEAAEGFRFCLKFPRVISHDLQLVNADAETLQFLQIVEILADAGRLGPSFLQMGPQFGPDRISDLQRYVEALPADYPWAVEVRHLGWFDQSDNESRLNDLLIRYGIDKVLFDSRPLYQLPPDDEIEVVSQTRKPKTPIRQTLTGSRPMLRLVGRNRVELVDRFLDQWCGIIAGWIEKGLEPYVFTHAPDDAFAPSLAERLLSRLNQERASFNFSVSPPRDAGDATQLSFLD